MGSCAANSFAGPATSAHCMLQQASVDEASQRESKTCKYHIHCGEHGSGWEVAVFPPLSLPPFAAATAASTVAGGIVAAAASASSVSFPLDRSLRLSPTLLCTDMHQLILLVRKRLLSSRAYTYMRLQGT